MHKRGLIGQANRKAVLKRQMKIGLLLLFIVALVTGGAYAFTAGGELSFFGQTIVERSAFADELEAFMHSAAVVEPHEVYRSDVNIEESDADVEYSNIDLDAEAGEYATGGETVNADTESVDDVTPEAEYENTEQSDEPEQDPMGEFLGEYAASDEVVDVGAESESEVSSEADYDFVEAA